MSLHGVLFVVFAALMALASPAWAGAGDEHAEAPAGDAELGGYVPGAAVLDGRLLAPCCWNQTLDIHGSPSANALRKEIRQRLKSGESVEAVEAAIVERYGEKIRAVPKGSPLQSFATVLALLFGVAGGLSVWMLLRWKRRRAELVQKSSGKKGDAKRDRFDDAIDAELERL
jgi:cytochrome c-type biogenesis protein CcmH